MQQVQCAREEEILSGQKSDLQSQSVQDSRSVFFDPVSTCSNTPDSDEWTVSRAR